MSNGDIRDLLNKGETSVIKGFNSKAGKAFSASVTFDADFNTVFVFPETKSDKNSKRKRK
ncbi:DNA topoisomerase III [Mucinivorans hirudinis]|uniref:DNA topoisomerase III n=1 Tax=Mucinivorans hirudinis TaxID=1433126 RepID=A0A060RAV3_9BACT|nr:DNA topoisomerase III [Mucinivorans hirudinis]